MAKRSLRLNVRASVGASPIVLQNCSKAVKWLDASPDVLGCSHHDWSSDA